MQRILNLFEHVSFIDIYKNPRLTSSEIRDTKLYFQARIREGYIQYSSPVELERRITVKLIIFL